MQITIVKEQYAAQAEALDMLGKPIPAYMIEETVECTAEPVQLPMVTEAEIDELLAEFTKWNAGQ